MIEQYYGGEKGFWDFLMQRKSDMCLLGCSIKGNGKEGQLILDGTPTGLILNHAYGINDIMELQDPFDKTGKTPLRMLRLRNPWGNSEWTGAWSGESAEMKKYRKVFEQYIQTLPPDEQFDLDADDGTFMMCYDDWKDQFSTLFLNIDFPEDWTGVRFQSKWTKSNSGGIPAAYQKDLLDRYAQNPQFFVRPAYDTELMISMTQTGGRLPINGQYLEYPFAETLNYAAVGVFKLQSNQSYLQSFDKNALHFMSPIKRERENSGRCKLEANCSYVIVCSTELAGTMGEFFLSIYFNQALRDMAIKRVFHPMDKSMGKEQILPYFIPEEAEKLMSSTPIWKIQLVKESLKYMMTDEDGGPMP